MKFGDGFVIAHGSSPLARGLQGSFQSCQSPSGIIPARAGFTTGPCSPAISAPDHPRSRGVYVSWGDCSHSRLGSSPLARGLPPRRTWPWRSWGIIPARAGFTCSCRLWCMCTGDHPRSRGVYPSRAPNRIRDPGSSPLARGLPPRRTWPWRSWGIIPARAGFTCSCRLWCMCTGDHPRSRGVYPSRAPNRIRDPGSSPLARGLRPEGFRQSIRGRIIPARAGFTAHRHTGPTTQ